MVKEIIKQKIKFWIVILIVVIAIAFAIFTVLKYEVEGEKNVPFEIGKIIVISSATTSDANNEEQKENNENVENSNNQENIENSSEETQEEKYLWKEKVVQTNDVYIYLDKNTNFKEQQQIKSVKIENIQILKNVNLGKIQVYMPNSLDGEIYKYTNDFLVNSSLTYKGALADNKKTLEIGNQGGCICISFANVGLGEYKSNDDEQIEQGAYILEKMGINNEDIKFKVCFDLIIEVQDKSYKTNIALELPIDDVVGKKETHKEFKEFEKAVFKRM